MREDLEQMSSREEWGKQDQEKERREDKKLPGEGQQLPGTVVCASLIRKALSVPSAITAPMKSLQPAFYTQENRDTES